MPVACSSNHFLVCIYYRIQDLYRFASREVKRLDSITRSPLFQQFSETLNGLETIRAYQMQNNLTKQHASKLTKNLRANYLVYVLNRWLSLRLEIIGSFVVLLTALFAVLQKTSLDSGTTNFLHNY